MSGILKHFEREEILSYPDILFNINGVDLSFHRLVYGGWHFKIKQSHHKSRINLMASCRKPGDTRSSSFRLAIRRLPLRYDDVGRLDWRKFFEELNKQLEFVDEYVSFSNNALFTAQKATRSLVDFSIDELLTEVASRYPKPKKKQKPKFNNIIDITAELKKLREQLQTEERQVA